jgi:mRNA-degrading endonuclease RelE of RelBE toxin-antitoxin system
MYTIDVTIDALEDLRFLRKHEQERIFEEIEKQLTYQPTLQTRNRKPLRPNALVAWELRIVPFRIFYDINETKLTVSIVTVGRKNGNRLFIRGIEYSL